MLACDIYILEPMDSLLTRFNEQLPDALTLLDQMVSMESPSFDKELTDKFVRFTAGKFQALGGEVEIVPAQKVGDHLRANFGPASAGGVLLLGHTDTVWPAGELVKRPFKIDSGRAMGPGV